MNREKIIKLTNRVAYYTVGLLIYWVFIFVTITIFDLKVFRKNMTEAFYLSVLGIFALLGGAIVLNIMLNMTKISECLAVKLGEASTSVKESKKKWLLLLLTFPVIFLLLCLGDYSSSYKKKNHLVETADFLIKENKTMISTFTKYSFDENYIESVSNSLKVLAKIEEKFPNIRVIVRDTIHSKTVFLSFSKWYNKSKDKEAKKEDFIFSSSKEERIYLNGVFDGKETSVKFSAHDGYYELYYPVTIESKTIVLYLSDIQRYGKIGS